MPASIKCAILTLIFFTARTAISSPLLSYESAGNEGGYPNDKTLLGWSFTVTTPVTITHLGLYDANSDGFDVAHPIGLFRQRDGVELTSGMVSSGVADPLLIDYFRYIDVPDVTLVYGESYVLSYYTSDPGTTNRDYQISFGIPMTINSAITFGESLWQGDAPSLAVPSNQRGGGPYWVGPNALFAPVPLPPAVWFFGSALGLMGVMRRKISG